jgi:hypothetical protein
MRHMVLTAAVFSLMTSAAFAQGMPAQQGPANPAVKTTDGNNAPAPVAGANSFTRSQAINKIEALGYIQVTGLKKGADGVWRGTATKDGRSVPVSVDYQGNVNN